MEIKEAKNSHLFIPRKIVTVLCLAHVGFTLPRFSGLQILPQEKILSNSSEYQDFFFFREAYIFIWHSHFKLLY